MQPTQTTEQVYQVQMQQPQIAATPAYPIPAQPVQVVAYSPQAAQFVPQPNAAAAAVPAGVDPNQAALLWQQQYNQLYQQYYNYYQQQSQQVAVAAANAAAVAAQQPPPQQQQQQQQPPAPGTQTQAWGVPQPNQNGLYSLFVYHLPRSVTEKALQDLFSQYGNVVEAVVMRENMQDPTSPNKGYGFVNYKSFHEAQAAIDGLNGYHIENKRLQVTFKTDKKGGKKGGNGK